MDNVLADLVEVFMANFVQVSLKQSSKRVVKDSLQDKAVCGLKLAPGPPRRTVPIVPPTKLLILTLAVTLLVNKGKNKALGIFRH